MLIVLFFYQFEIITKLNVKINSAFDFKKELIVYNPEENERNLPSKGLINYLKSKGKNYLMDFKGLLSVDFKNQLIRISIAYLAAILLITLTFNTLGFVFFIFI